jgi:hypothetical protein
MTHGDKNGIVYACDGGYCVNTLWKYFTGDRCPSLIGKPKLFFVQACRGTLVDPGALFEPESNISKRKLQSRAAKCDNNKYVISTLADIMIMFSTFEGYFSFRSSTKGSWFIQALCTEIEKYRKTGEKVDLMKILIGVNRSVAYAKQSNSKLEQLDCAKQMPVIMAMLTKSLIFDMSKYQ